MDDRGRRSRASRRGSRSTAELHADVADAKAEEEADDQEEEVHQRGGVGGRRTRGAGLHDRGGGAPSSSREMEEDAHDEEVDLLTGAEDEGLGSLGRLGEEVGLLHVKGLDVQEGLLVEVLALLEAGDANRVVLDAADPKEAVGLQLVEDRARHAFRQRISDHGGRRHLYQLP